MDFAAAEHRLNELTMFGIKLGLEQVRELLDRVGSPDRGLRFIHIAGSNGKGSVGALLASALHNAGFETGFFSSPHLISVRERFRVNGKAILPSEFSSLMDEMMPAIEEMRAAGHCPTYFEVNTVMAAMFFARRKTDFVVWETGMGGRLDATNIVRPIASVITGISLEHQQYLGNTLAEIAGEKAGIIKTDIPVFTGIIPDEAAAVIAARAAAVRAPLFQLPQEYRHAVKPVFHSANFTQSFTLGSHRLKLRLAGHIQQHNAALALQVLEYLAPIYKFSLESAIDGMGAAVWPGRLQLLPRGIILDGAHNPEGAAVLVKTMREYFPGKRFTIIFGGLADKDTEAVLRELALCARQFIFVPLAGPRPCRTPAQLRAMLAGIDASVPSQEASDLGEALDSAVGTPPVLITGSLYLAGETLVELLPQSQTFNI